MAGNVARGEVRFEVDGPPVAEPRQRVEIRWRKAATGRMTAYPHHYVRDDHPIHAYKQAVQLTARQAKPKGWDTSASMEVEILAIFPRRADQGTIGRVWHRSKFDGDNIAKGVLDTLRTVLFDDDEQVVDLRVAKVHAREGERPRTVVRVRRKCEEVPGLEIEI